LTSTALHCRPRGSRLPLTFEATDSPSSHSDPIYILDRAVQLYGHDTGRVLPPRTDEAWQQASVARPDTLYASGHAPVLTAPWCTWPKNSQFASAILVGCEIPPQPSRIPLFDRARVEHNYKSKALRTYRGWVPRPSSLTLANNILKRNVVPGATSAATCARWSESKW
jgi:hypothetical protein